MNVWRNVNAGELNCPVEARTTLQVANPTTFTKPDQLSCDPTDEKRVSTVSNSDVRKWSASKNGYEEKSTRIVVRVLLIFKRSQLQLVEAGLARKEMRTTNAPSKQNEVMSQPQPTGQQESVSVKCGACEIIFQRKIGHREIVSKVVGSNPTYLTSRGREQMSASPSVYSLKSIASIGSLIN